MVSLGLICLVRFRCWLWPSRGGGGFVSSGFGSRLVLVLVVVRMRGRKSSGAQKQGRRGPIEKCGAKIGADGFKGPPTTYWAPRVQSAHFDEVSPFSRYFLPRSDSDSRVARAQFLPRRGGDFAASVHG